MNAYMDLFQARGAYESSSEKQLRTKSSKVVVSSAVHAEIATLATHIQQLKERLMAQPTAGCPTSQSETNDHCGEEESFPTWLN